MLPRQAKRLKEEAEANAARNRSSLQVSLTSPPSQSHLQVSLTSPPSLTSSHLQVSPQEPHLQVSLTTRACPSLTTRACTNSTKHVISDAVVVRDIGVKNRDIRVEEKKHVKTGPDKNPGGGNKSGVRHDNLVLADDASKHAVIQNKNGILNHQNMTKSGNRTERSLPQIDKNLSSSINTTTSSRGMMDNCEVPVVLLNSSGMAPETISEKVRKETISEKVRKESISEKVKVL